MLFQFVERNVDGGERLEVRGGGRLVMGQDLDSLEGSFNVRQSLHGDIADFVIYPQALDSDALKLYTKCGQLETGEVEPIIYFNSDMTMFKVLGSTSVSKISLDDLCRQDESRLIMVTQTMDFSSSYTLCSILKGRLAVPKNEEENTKIYNDFLIFNDLCVLNWGSLYWLGIKGDVNSGQWFVLPEMNSLGWSNFPKGWGTVKPNQDCASVGGEAYPREWYRTPCDIQTCPLCDFPHTPMLRVRGLCSSSLVDQTLYLRDYKNDQIQLHGSYHTVIEWNPINLTWKLANRGHEDLHGYMVMKRPGEMPFGVHTWEISGDNCPSTQVR